jgi:hypothetical protein
MVKAYYFVFFCNAGQMYCSDSASFEGRLRAAPSTVQVLRESWSASRDVRIYKIVRRVVCRGNVKLLQIPPIQ